MKKCRTCNNCKALTSNLNCDLGFKNERYAMWGIYIGANPLEPCLKPLNNFEYIRFYEQKKKIFK